MSLSDVENLYQRKRVSVGGGAREPKPREICTAQERNFILKRRDKARYQKSRRKF